MNADLKRYFAPDTALDRLGGNEKLYVRLLRQFFESGYCKELEDAFLSGDKNLFGVTAHAVKGVSSNLALTEIYFYCKKFESNIKFGFDSTEDVATFKRVYEKTEKTVADYIAERNE